MGRFAEEGQHLYNPGAQRLKRQRLWVWVVGLGPAWCLIISWRFKLESGAGPKLAGGGGGVQASWPAHKTGVYCVCMYVRTSTYLHRLNK